MQLAIQQQTLPTSDSLFRKEESPQAISSGSEVRRAAQPSKELNVLRARLHELQQKSVQLEARSCELSNTVMDLRHLVKVVAKERSDELEMLRSNNKQKVVLKQSLEAGLTTAYRCEPDFNRAERFWADFC